MSNKSLRTLIESRLDARWDEWAKRHPHLAAAIDKVRLTDAAVESIRDDPDFVAAMQQADLDEAGLLKAARLLDHADGLVRRLLP